LAKRPSARLILRSLVVLAAIGFGLLGYIYLTLPDVRVLATENPESTAWMELRTREAAMDGRTIRHVRRWVPYSRISNHLKRAVLVAEDSAFWEHEGVDYEQVRDAIRVSWEQGTAVRGASTITQQLAKNLYLSPSQDPLRKLRELIIARRMEASLPKARIFEIYLNSIEWGDGVWGAEAASRKYFGIPASALNAEQAALLAGAIINPRVHNPARPTARLRNRQQIILRRMGEVTPPPPAPVVVESAPPPLSEELFQPLPDAVEPPPPGPEEGAPLEPAPLELPPGDAPLPAPAPSGGDPSPQP
jgi:monofunctional biosynthetic peptidoglycan transglycosylase